MTDDLEKVLCAEGMIELAFLQPKEKSKGNNKLLSVWKLNTHK